MAKKQSNSAARPSTKSAKSAVKAKLKAAPASTPARSKPNSKSTTKPIPKSQPKSASKSRAAFATSTASSGKPTPVSTGPGASPAEVGRDFVALFNARTPDSEIWDKLFSNDFVSVEGHGVSLAFSGRDAVQAKCDTFLDRTTIHGCACEGPFIGARCFAVRFRIDCTDNASGRREIKEEIAVYSIARGKVIGEEFCYLTP